MSGSGVSCRVVFLRATGSGRERAELTWHDERVWPQRPSGTEEISCMTLGKQCDVPDFSSCEVGLYFILK